MKYIMIRVMNKIYNGEYYNTEWVFVSTFTCVTTKEKTYTYSMYNKTNTCTEKDLQDFTTTFKNEIKSGKMEVKLVELNDCDRIINEEFINKEDI